MYILLFIGVAIVSSEILQKLVVKHNSVSIVRVTESTAIQYLGCHICAKVPSICRVTAGKLNL